MINEKNIKTLGTHSGKFHADDVMATAILKLLVGDIKVTRTRDEDILRKLDLFMTYPWGNLTITK